MLGYSKHDAWTYHLDSQLNLAEIGASSADMPYMAKMLVQRIKMDKRINFKKSWKMVTIAIGGNDICSFICQMDEPESLPRKHKQRLVKTLRYLRDNLPRFVFQLIIFFYAHRLLFTRISFTSFVNPTSHFCLSLIERSFQLCLRRL